MTRVAVVPVISRDISVQQRVFVPRNAFQHQRWLVNRRHIQLRNDESINRFRDILRQHCLERHQVKDSVDCVMCAGDSDEFDGSLCEVQMLPAAAMVERVINDNIPHRLLDGNFNGVRIRTIVEVPKKKFEEVDDENVRQFNDDSIFFVLRDCVPCVTFFHVVGKLHGSAGFVEDWEIRLVADSLNDASSVLRERFGWRRDLVLISQKTHLDGRDVLFRTNPPSMWQSVHSWLCFYMNRV